MNRSILQSWSLCVAAFFAENIDFYAISPFCRDGTRVQGQFITGSGTESGTGTVTDSVGNTYKLLF